MLCIQRSRSLLCQSEVPIVERSFSSDISICILPAVSVTTMKSILLAVLPVASAASVPVEPRQSYFSFGNFFSTGGVASNTFIRRATTTLVLPALNSPHDGNLGLWPGMGTKFDSGADGHLVQGLAISTVGAG